MMEMQKNQVVFFWGQTSILDVLFFFTLHLMDAFLFFSTSEFKSIFHSSNRKIEGS